ncbi:MAG: homoserine dehydrogenase [Clostridiales bacterium]|nr:homoserine dehydrogenase [Clostridiales bacterium]
MYVAIMGYGTIGSGVAEILETNKAEIAAAAGQEVVLKYVLDLREFPGSPIEDRLIHDFKMIEEDPEVGMVVETMGGLNPAYPFVKACLLAGKHVATSNKALVAAHGTELLAIAREKQVNFLFEASVGGGIPVIRTLYRSMSGEKIRGITGILNGTTNYILTRMSEAGSSFEAALKEAQNLGYAERNPEADVEGYDTCRKIAILTAMVSGKEVSYEEIHTEGITKITDIDFQYAKKMGTCVKLFGSSRIGEDSVQAWVAPVMIGPGHPLYAVRDVYNGILITSNMLGQTMLYGSGAGKLPTGGAVVADIIEAVQNPHSTIPFGWSAERETVADFSLSSHQYFVRIAGNYSDHEEKVAAAFGNVQVMELDGMDEFAVLTGSMTEEEYQKKAGRFEVRQMIRAEL